MLELRALQTGYGETRVIHGLDLAVRAGRFHALMGRNGAGKTTTLKAVMGLLPVMEGDIVFEGASLKGRKPFETARAGIAYVPETRDVFGSLSVAENLRLAARLGAGRAGGWTIERVLAFFPNLAGRLENGGNQLSGGEQQMLAIARALVMNPKLLLLDEPTEGLAPILVKQIFDKLLDLKQSGMTLLLVEQNFDFATRLADEVTIIGRGQAAWTGTPEALRADPTIREKWLGV